MMKKIVSITVLIVIGVIATLGWYSYPWKIIIEKRINDVGAAKIATIFDLWVENRGDLRSKWENISIDDLPHDFKVLGASEAILRNEGLYLLMRRGFVEEDYILIRSKEPFPVMIYSGDPKFSEIRNRIWFVQIKG
jgi:hypothetical protein